MKRHVVHIAGAMAILGLGLLWPTVARAHCDTLDGPVVTDARSALDRGDVTPVLKWVQPAGEHEVRTAFTNTVAVRRLSPEAKALADRYFFETLVRVHRAGEGAPYTGLKPAGLNPGPAVTGADAALTSGKIDPLISQVTDEVAAGIRERFAHAHEAQQHANDSVAAGRAYVDAYVEYVHYVERIHQAVASPMAHEGAPDTDAPHDRAGEHSDTHARQQTETTHVGDVCGHE